MASKRKSMGNTGEGQGERRTGRRSGSRTAKTRRGGKRHGLLGPLPEEKGRQATRQRAAKLDGLFALIAVLSDTRYGLTVHQVLDRLEGKGRPMSKSTFHRYLKDLAKLGIPVHAENRNGSFFYRIPREAVRDMLHLPLGLQREALHVALELLAGLKGAAWYGELARFASRWKIVEEAASQQEPGRGALPEPRTATTLVVRWASTSANPEVMAAVDRALRDGRRLHIRYQGVRDASPRWRRVDPAALQVTGRALYLHAWCLERNAPRRFKLTRLHEAEVTHEPAEHAGRVDVQGRIARAAVAWDGEPVAVAVWLSPRVARFAAEYPLHEEQRVTAQPDGSAVVRATVAGLVEPARWVVSWGREAKALEPPELVEAVREELAEALARYEEAPGSGTPQPPTPQ